MSTDIAIVRTAQTADLDALLALARAGGDGLTNLPADRDVLAAKLDASVAALHDAGARERGAAILLMTECGGAVIGTSCVFARVGADWPFYSYRLTRQTAVSRALGRSKAQTLLNLVNDFDGETEVGGLFIAPAHRGDGTGRLTARARYLFIATHRDWFKRRVIAELRGFQDDTGRSPVWEALGRHFYDMDFADADRTNAITGNQFIADLGPRYPIYRSLLPTAAQAALGRPHDDGRGAYKMLIEQGFRADDYVDIFDGGPTMVAEIDEVRTVREARALQLAGIAEGGTPALVATGAGETFRAVRTLADTEAAGVHLPAAAAQALGVGPGDTVLCSAN